MTYKDAYDFAEAMARKQLDDDEARESAIRADERAKVLDELRTFVEALDLGYWDRMAFLEKCGEMREGLE